MTSGAVTDGGNTLHLWGNSWKAITVNYTITPDTVLEFDFSSASQGEQHRIGFDTDHSLAVMPSFDLWGTEAFGTQDYAGRYHANAGTVHYRIPVGEYAEFVGTQTYLIVNADDDGGSNADSVYSNVRVYESAAAIDFSGLTLHSYDPARDETPTQNAVLDGGQTLHLWGNTWKAIQVDYTLTADTVLELDFKSGIEGEYHALAFDNNLTGPTGGGDFQLFGTQTAGQQAFNTYELEDGWVHYRIPVGDYLTGAFTYLILTNDDDDATPTAESYFRNCHWALENRPLMGASKPASGRD